VENHISSNSIYEYWRKRLEQLSSIPGLEGGACWIWKKAVAKRVWIWNDRAAVLEPLIRGPVKEFPGIFRGRLAFLPRSMAYLKSGGGGDLRAGMSAKGGMMFIPKHPKRVKVLKAGERNSYKQMIRTLFQSAKK
jgi:hypothetical protein